MSGGIRRRAASSKSFLFAALLLQGCPSLPPDQVQTPPAPEDSGRETRRPGDATAQAPRWPPLPRDDRAARRLIEARTQRPVEDAQGAFAVSAIPQRLEAQGLAGVVAGERAIAGWLEKRLAAANAAGRDAYLLVGSYHDSGGQLRAFRRLVGPGGVGGMTNVAVEQLQSDGRWRNLSPWAQRGDDQLLEAWLDEGQRDALEQLGQRQRDHNYTAWRYGYLDEVTDLLMTARAAQLPLEGCDLPRSVSHELQTLTPPLLDGLRELHCLSSLERRAIPRRVAIFLGDSHVQPGGLPRFLESEALALVIHLVGHRAAHLPEGQLRQQLALTAAVLIPVAGEDELALLLPGTQLAAEVDRSRSPPRPPAEAQGGEVTLRVDSDQEGTFLVGDRTIAIAAERSVEVIAPRRAAPYAFHTDDLWFLGDLEATSCRTLELVFDVADRRLRSLCLAD